MYFESAGNYLTYPIFSIASKQEEDHENLDPNQIKDSSHHKRTNKKKKK